MLKKESHNQEALRHSKEEMIKIRIAGVQDSIQEQCPNKKIEILIKKLQEANKNAKQVLGRTS